MVSKGLSRCSPKPWHTAVLPLLPTPYSLLPTPYSRKPQGRKSLTQLKTAIYGE
ncbi:MAG: hypothetical protein F6J94_10675 [Moorea sp. SIO1F2]|uniref:hypothetical protein n=1 Tax=unclassified Moorena TaxID=2683338 RepID=UPI0013BA2D86|nr:MULTISPECIES: hypothetical protein [unclassified Moorena]NEN94865.1 hypothetical protein [Moorena sp. SIO3I7]NEO10301.1 hypothetical protein [Moorena sp. SIO3I8]NEO21906.1 hypothetical protein [Moorena sp. SIO4A5]NEP24552.1 hypothetical protein [Moorena sp. SIO3I6]NEQ60463.1 hypothetical protein [Moorena sp. SIO4A1]